MRVRARTAGALTTGNGGFTVGGAGGKGESGEEWEVRPGGMLVQKRNPDLDRNTGVPPPTPTIRVRVKHGSRYHEISISSQATFGELKELLTGPTGLHHQDQKLIFKDKERCASSFLDMVGVKDGSKVVLVMDPISQEKRYLEIWRSAKMENSLKSVSDISLEIDRLAGQLRRVQKYVETLDMLKVENSMQSSDRSQAQTDYKLVDSNGVLKPNPVDIQQRRHSNVYSYAQAHRLPWLAQASQTPARHSTSGAVVTMNWETFDAAPPLIPATATPSSAANNAAQPNSN